MNAAQAVALPTDRPRNRPGRPRAALYLVPSPATAAATLPPLGSLRLTRRGRVVVATAAALLVAALSTIAATAAQATSHPAAQSATRQDLVQVVVRSGQNLWSVAESTDPNADPRVVIQRIIDLNGLTGDLIQPGQSLWVPRN